MSAAAVRRPGGTSLGINVCTHLLLGSLFAVSSPGDEPQSGQGLERPVLEATNPISFLLQSGIRNADF